MSGQLSGVGGEAYDRGMDTREAAQRWADVWERGWHEHDAVAITALYAELVFPSFAVRGEVRPTRVTAWRLWCG